MIPRHTARGLRPIHILALITLVAVIVAGIICRQAVLRLLPLCFSVLIMLLNSGASRYGYLAGGLNSILYGFSYLHYGLYGSMFQAFLVSCPIQLVTFILWSRRAYKSSTVFRRMSNKLRVLSAVGSVAAYAGYLAFSLNIGASHPYIDSAIFISGIVLPILSLCSFYEYAYIQVFTSPLTTVLYAVMLPESPDILVYLIFSIYSYICVIRQLVSVRRLRLEQAGDSRLSV